MHLKNKTPYKNQGYNQINKTKQHNTYILAQAKKNHFTNKKFLQKLVSKNSHISFKHSICFLNQKQKVLQLK